MFFGSIPKEVQSMIADIVSVWECKELFVGCSGNFTIEKMLSPMKKFHIHSNDVTLYSYCIGNYLCGNNVDLVLTAEGKEKIGWIEAYFDTAQDKLAALLLASSMVRYMDKKGVYYDKMYKEYVKQFQSLHEKTKERIEKNETKIDSYFNGDVMEFVENSPEDCGFISYPPFKNAGKAFIKDFQKLESLFQFQMPEYKIFNEQLLENYFKNIMSKKYWMFVTDIRLGEEFEPYLKSSSKTTNRGIAIYIYSNSGKTRYIGPKQETEQLNIPRIMLGEEVGNHIKLNLLSPNAFQTLRSEYMNINIRPGAATLAIGVFVDEKLIGVYAFSAASSLAKWDTYIDTPTMYLLSDFPVEPVDYDRLAKLVLYAALSKESKMIAERLVKKRVKSLITTAFSKNPSSMKYRGLFKVLNRKENHCFSEDWSKDIDPSNAYYRQKYEINYGAKIGAWSLEEGLKMWKQKHSQRTGKKERY